MRRLFALLLLLAAAPLGAADYVAAPGSRLGFESSYDGEAFAGRFERFTPRIRFDPARLGEARFDVAIDLASVASDNDERDEMLAAPEFFDSGAMPQARYLATRFRALGGGRFVAEGVLSLRGVEKAVPLAFTWTPGANPVLEGEATLDRLAFGVGAGEWADTSLLPATVVVRTRLVLTPDATPAAP